MTKVPLFYSEAKLGSDLKTKKTDPMAKSVKEIQVENIRVIHFKGASFRGATFDGAFWLVNQEGDFLKKHGDKLKVEAYFLWKGGRNEKAGLNITVTNGDLQVEENYSGFVVSEIA